MDIIEIDGSISNLNPAASSTSIDLDRYLNRRVILNINKIKNKMVFELGCSELTITCDPLMLDILTTNTSFTFPPISTSTVKAGTLIGNDVYLDRYMDPYTLVSSVPFEYIIKYKLEEILNGVRIDEFEYLIKIVRYGS